MREMGERSNLKFVISDHKQNVTYRREHFLGKGGFARCYEFVNMKNNEVFAGKVISKSSLRKPQHKEKVFQEIKIHSTLKHENIVKLHSYFEDMDNIYIIMELCRRRSLMEMWKRRKTLTVPEVRYFMKQLVTTCKYMHGNMVIHRDLKLSNLFIDDQMSIKVGDFGLAAQLSHHGERKKTLCGTPNYIAPEILNKSGHSYECDIWSLGCIMFTLLVGYPPFDSSSVSKTYSKIRKCDYEIPQSIDEHASKLIKGMLHTDPSKRPSADDILRDDFLTCGFLPVQLPTSCLTMQPRFNMNMSLCEVSKANIHNPHANFEQPKAMQRRTEMEEKAKAFQNQSRVISADYHLEALLHMVQATIDCNPESLYSGQPEDAQDPSAVPFIWVSKWVDYTDKYGLGYQLSDNTIGVYFNDTTHLVQLQAGQNLQYMYQDGKELYCTFDQHPDEIRKKVVLLRYFNTYMDDNLEKAGEHMMPRESADMLQVPHLRAWFRTKGAIAFHLTNGTFQANFYRDHTKVILCPLMEAASLIDKDKNFSVYTFRLVKQFGCDQLLAKRLRDARDMLQRFLADLKQTPPAVPQTSSKISAVV